MNGRYMAAARGPKNVAAHGGISKAMDKMMPNTVKPRTMGSMAGYSGGKSAWIEMNGAGYQKRFHGSKAGNVGKTRKFDPGSKPLVRADCYTKPTYHGVTKDRDLSRKL